MLETTKDALDNKIIGSRASSKPSKRRKRNIGLACGSFLISFVLFSMFFFPIVNDKTGYDLLMGYINDVNSVSDAPIDEIKEPYLYWSAPPDSFGIESTKDVNVTFYRNWLNTTVVWSLQKSTDNNHWVDCNKLLEVKKDWNPDNLSEKHTLSWVSDNDAYYQLLLKTDDVKTYQDLSNSKDAKSDKMLLNFSITDTEDYNIYYDWSDYSKSAEYNKTTFTKSVDVISSKQVFSWKVYTSQKLAKDEKMVIDPTFGGVGDTGDVNIHSVVGNCILFGVRGTASGGDGTADNITVKFGTLASTETYMCALYAYTDNVTNFAGAWIANTTTHEVLSTEDNTLQAFTFSSPPTITNGVTYYVCVKATTETGTSSTNNIRSGGIAGEGLKITSGSILTFGDPLTGESASTNNYIYCSYSLPFSNTAPTITANSENPLNQSTNVGLSLAGNYSHFNITVGDADATDTMNITWSTNESGSWLTMGTNASVANGTYYCTNISFVDSYSTKYWWNVSVNDGMGNWVNATYYFTTVATVKSWQTVNNWNGSIYNVTNWILHTDWNGSIWNSSDEWVLINNYNGTIYNVSGEDWEQIDKWDGRIYNGTGKAGIGADIVLIELKSNNITYLGIAMLCLIPTLIGIFLYKKRKEDE